MIFSNKSISGTKKIELLDSWRSLTRNQQEKALALIKKYCNPKRFSGSKTDKRDYHNWKNETQQLMSLFKMTVYFQVFGNQFALNTGDIGIFRTTRKTKTKNKFFEKHKINKQKNYELHHIVPLSYARNKQKCSQIDSFENLIYLHEDKHDEIKKDHIIFNAEDPRISFKHRFEPNDVITAKRGENTNFNPVLLDKIQKYNAKLRTSLLDDSKNE